MLNFDRHHVARGRIERVFGRDEDVLHFTRGFFSPLPVIFGTCRRRPNEAEPLLRPVENADHTGQGAF
jgi:hypothetical protein